MLELISTIVGFAMIIWTIPHWMAVFASDKDSKVKNYRLASWIIWGGIVLSIIIGVYEDKISEIVKVDSSGFSASNVLSYILLIGLVFCLMTLFTHNPEQKAKWYKVSSWIMWVIVTIIFLLGVLSGIIGIELI